MRESLIFKIPNPKEFRFKLLDWLESWQPVLFLNSNEYNLSGNHLYCDYDILCAVGETDHLICNSSDAFESLKIFQQNSNDWIFGHLNYDLKNSIENLTSENHDGIEIPDIYFFRPLLVFLLKDNNLEILFQKNTFSKNEVNEIFEEINSIKTMSKSGNELIFNLKSRMSKVEYLLTVKEILENIQRGEIYEMNYCQEFYCEGIDINPIEIYKSLNHISPNPFSSFYNFGNYYLLSGSPERFIKKSGNKIISQPIKGTIRRGITIDEDNELKDILLDDQKERSENIMIVDLVRNDLSKSALRGSVNVEELCKIYSYPKVHQMISTISCIKDPEVPTTDIIKFAFPMGSMTGAPKVRAMELIEKYEKSKRGLYSGSVGYFTPDGDFDFNVVIRSILYNSEKKYLSFHVGSAITIGSDPEMEFNECLIKAEAIKESLGINSDLF